MNFVNDFSSILCIIKVLFITFYYIERLHFNSCNALPQMQASAEELFLTFSTLSLSPREEMRGQTEGSSKCRFKCSTLFPYPQYIKQGTANAVPCLIFALRLFN